MCSICGGTRWDDISAHIWEQAKDRGRDDEGLVLGKSDGWIGNRRATPTTEVLAPIERQPVGNDRIRLVFNGIVSNDKALSVKEGEADTSVLPRTLNFDSLEDFRDSLQEKIIGSYAIAVKFDCDCIWLACNYKPIWIAEYEGHYYFSSLAHHFPKKLTPYRMPPYSVQHLESRSSNIPIQRTQSPNAVVICSSGLDSTAVAAYAVYKHGKHNTTLIHFNYGCKATSKEIEAIRKIRDYFGCKLEIIPMVNFGGSSLLEEGDQITDGIKGAEYAHEWVPARNLMMLSHATAYAEAKGFGHIYLGTNLEESGAYPDNEEQFILDFNNLLWGAVQNGIKVEVHTPLGGLMKHEIVQFGMRYKAPFDLTWSCYRGGEKACGKCGPCWMRQTAFQRNGLVDPIQYESD